MYVIVPGIGGSGSRHWQTLWERDWGRDAVRIAPRSWDEPELADWVDSVRLAVAGLSARSEAVVLVAHSLGCWAAAEWMRESRPDGVAALLVAPPGTRSAHFPASAASSFTGLTARPLPGPALTVASGDDPYCNVDTSRSLALRWNAEWHLAGDHGHINADSRVGAWPEGKEILAAFLGG